MKKHVVKAGRYSIRGIGLFAEFFLAFVLTWWLSEAVLSRIPVDGSNERGGELVRVYITSNGIHSDVVVPVVSEQINWGMELGIARELKQDTSRQFLGFGWGNERFFMNTRNWSDLTFGTAFGASFHLGTSAMHVVQEYEPVDTARFVIPLDLSKEQYANLVVYLKQSFKRQDDHYLQIKEHPYSDFDFFFEAVRSYGFTYTCNSWTNDALKASGQKACVWTAFKDGIYLQYGKGEN